MESSQQQQQKNAQEKQLPINRPLKLITLHCQFDCKLKDIEGNIKRIKVSLSKYKKKDQIDVVLLPEMIFTGYIFKNKEDIKPYLEECGKGPCFQFVSEVASQLNAYVFAGYAELYKENQQTQSPAQIQIQEQQQQNEEGKQQNQQEQQPKLQYIEKYYNSAYLVNRDGTLLYNYRKHFLYESDEVWAEEGESFKAIDLVNTEGKTFRAGLAICMDINPYKFQNNNNFELAQFCQMENIDALFFISAWTDHEPNNQSDKSIDAMHDYWLWRLKPLVNKQKDSKPNYNKSWAFLCADRVGKENNYKIEKGKQQYTTYFGSSCCIKLNPYERVYYLKKQYEGILKSEIKLE